MNPDRKDNTQIVLTNHELCSICQEQTNESLVNTGHSRFKKDSYNKLLENVHKRAKLGNSKYFGSSNKEVLMKIISLKISCPGIQVATKM